MTMKKAKENHLRRKIFSSLLFSSLLFSSLLFSSLLFLTLSCQKEEIDPAPAHTQGQPQMLKTAPAEGLIVLGQKLENPYSLGNMQRALSELRTRGETWGSIPTSLPVTDLYVRFLPADTTELNKLTQVYGLELFDYPLDYEIVQGGSYYHDPTLAPEKITWLYTTVKPDFQFPDIQYEILEQCHIPSDNDDPFLDALEETAFQITGNEEMLSVGQKGKPSGYVMVWESKQNCYVGIRSIRVQVHNFVKWRSSDTDLNGYYHINEKYRTQVHYTVIFENNTGFKVWGNIGPLMAARWWLGWHSNNGYSCGIPTNSHAWLYATINNGAHIFREEICPQLGINKPPADLRLASQRAFNLNAHGSCPLSRHISLNSSNLINFLVSLGFIYSTAYISLIVPDIFIFKDYSVTSDAYSTVFHELAHASHYTKCGSGYWGNYVLGIISNGQASPYGDGNGAKDGYIGVGEMWANYIEYRAMNLYLAPNGAVSLGGIYTWFKPQILRDLINSRHFNEQKIFDCLTGDVDNHFKLKNKIISKYGQSTLVTQVFSTYGF